MNNALWAAVIAVGVLGCLNLLLTYGVIRRLRAYGEYAAQPGPADSPGPSRPAVGERVPPFAATSVTGVELSEVDLATGVSYLGFFSTGCPPCHEHLPRFVEALAGEHRVVIVVDDDGRDSRALGRFTELAGRVGSVVVEDPMGPVASALGVNRLPTMIAVHDGVVTANVHSFDQFPAPAPA